MAIQFKQTNQKFIEDHKRTAGRVNKYQNVIDALLKDKALELSGDEIKQVIGSMRQSLNKRKIYFSTTTLDNGNVAVVLKED